MDYSNGIKVVIGNYGYSAEGQLRDQAITLPVSNLELQDFLKLNGLSDAMHEETYVADFPDGAPFGNNELFEHASVQDVNLLARQLQETDSPELDKIEEWMSAFHDPNNITQLMNIVAQADLIEKIDFENSWGDSPEENYAIYVIDQQPELSDMLQAAGIVIDYQKTGYDRSIEDGVTLTDTGFIVDNGEHIDMDKFSHNDLIEMYGEESATKPSLDANVKDWYMENFPNDELGASISDSLTFGDALASIDKGDNVYDTLGVGDSVIRERLFDGLSEATGKSYGEVYNIWLRGAEKAKAEQTIRSGMKEQFGINPLAAKMAQAQQACEALAADAKAEMQQEFDAR